LQVVRARVTSVDGLGRPRCSLKAGKAGAGAAEAATGSAAANGVPASAGCALQVRALCLCLRTGADSASLLFYVRPQPRRMCDQCPLWWGWRRTPITARLHWRARFCNV